MFFTLVLASAVSLAAPAEIQHSIDTFVAKAPGVVVAVGTIKDGVVHEYFAGKPAVGAPALDERSEFQIGSITKTFTSTILADMVERGQVKLNDPIATYLPAGVKAPAYQGQAITLLNLAEQNSGLPRLPANLSPASAADPYAEYSDRQLYAFLDGYALTRAPGAQFEYSNLGVGLLGTLLAHAAHTSYPLLLEERVLGPLGMHDTSATLSNDIARRIEPGLANDLTMQTPWRFDALAGAGAINSDLHDMLIYLRANIDAPNGQLGKAMALAHEPRTESLPQQKIGLNWFVGPTGTVWHNGETGGYSSEIAFDPTAKIGIVVLTNVAPADGETDTLVGHLLEPERYPTFVAIVPPAVQGNSPFVGVYELAPSFHITITEDQGKLYGQGSGQPRFALMPNHDLTYTVEGVPASVTFVKDASGKVVSLILHQNGADQAAKRITP